MSSRDISEFMKSCKFIRMMPDDVKAISRYQELIRHNVELALIDNGQAMSKGGRGRKCVMVNFPLAVHYRLKGFSIEQAVDHFLHNYVVVV